MKKLFFLLLLIIITSISCKHNIQNDNLITIIDMLGDSITIPKNPKRVACISRTTYDLLIAFGLSDKVDGAYKNIYDNPWLEIIHPNSKNEYRYEYEENYETFLTRKIDLVFAPEKYIADNLKSHGINAVCISLYGNPTYDDYLYFFVDMIMTLWDNKDVHQKALKWKQEVNNAIINCCDLESNKNEIKKLFYVRGDKNKGIEYTDTRGSFTEFAFRKLGYEFAGKHFDTNKPSKEEICKYDPDIFVIGGIFQNILKNTLKNDEVYKNLKAVKNNKIFMIPFGLTSFEQLSITTPIFFYDMSNKLNYTNFNISKMVNSTFKDFFGVNLSESQINFILNGKDPYGININNEQ